MKTDINQNTINFDYNILMRKAYNFGTNKRSLEFKDPLPSSLMVDTYSRKYVIDKDFLLNTANIILPSASPIGFKPKDIPPTCYWTLDVDHF